jgi:hypothetical protein
MSAVRRLASAVAIVTLAACGGTTVPAHGNGDDGGASADSGGGNPETGTDGGTTSGDAAAEAAVEPPDNGPWPAMHYPMPQMIDMGGTVMKSAKIITVTFVGNSSRDTWRAFDDMIGPSAWWTAVTDGYGIGPGVGGVYAELPDTVSNKTLDDKNDLQPMIAQWVSQAALPPPDDNTVYVMYFPSSTTITLQGTQSCNDFGGYHNSTGINLADGGFADAAYAIIPDCGYGLTDTISHELAEVATDPHPMSGITYFGYDDAWWPAGGGEVADNCQNRGPADLAGNYVARSWNNKAAAESREPCQPALPGEIFYGAAVPTQVISGLSGPQGGGSYSSDGYIVMKRGATKVIDVIIFSEQKLPNDVQLVVGTHIRGDQIPTDVGPIGSGITGVVSPTSGHNGMHVTLTIQIDATASTGDYPFVVRSVLNQNDSHNWPVILRVL